MRARRFMFVVLGLLGAFGGAPPAAAAISGHTDWKAWRFDWEIKDGAGVAIRNVTYGGELVIYKASMPAIRVKYDGDACGPFTDRLTEYSLKSTVCAPDVCQRSYTLGGHEWLEVGIMEQIGGYEIYQAWYLSDDGQIQPHLWSRRYHCQVTHDHHAYWRLDIDVRGFPNDQIFVYDSNRPNEGWGSGWHKYPTEVNDLKNPSTRRAWFVRDDPSGHGVWLMPGRADGNPDSWSNRDMSWTALSLPRRRPVGVRRGRARLRRRRGHSREGRHLLVRRAPAPRLSGRSRRVAPRRTDLARPSVR